jgi:cyclic beta-1,2-glucan synthetase
LPTGYSRELPHLQTGDARGLPRVYDLAQELVAHVDGRVDAEHLTAFISAYQETTSLTLGELWAIPIMLRLTLIENLRRIATQLTEARKDRDLADEWADRMLATAENEPSKLIIEVARMAQADIPMRQAFVAEFWRRTQLKSPALKLAINWLEERLAAEGRSIEHLIHGENQDQATSQVSVGNSISSLRFLDAMDWREFVESLSLVEQALRQDPAEIYGAMDFQTRDAYRHVVEQISRWSGLSQLEIAQLAIKLAGQRGTSEGNGKTHVGHFLLGPGRTELERSTRARMPILCLPRHWVRSYPLAFYLGGIAAISSGAALLTFRLVVDTPSPFWLALVASGLALLPASQLGVSVVNWLTTLLLKPEALPRLDFSKGIPADHRTLVAVPCMLTSAQNVDRLLEALEIRHLANRDANLRFALLTDLSDAAEQNLPGDEALITQAREGIEALNRKHDADRRSVFYLFHRPRLWNEQSGVWMGYERKRGKLADLNRLLRGGSPECFSHIAGDLSALPRIQYVITLDADTQLPRDAAQQLAGAMAHPLNRPVYDESAGRVVQGYGILQPRVAVSLPGANRSWFARIFSGEPGIDPYTRAVSDVYQDLFREGSFIGKGIYDIDCFERTVGNKFPENRILSHDLLEGSYARAGLLTDVLLFEEFPLAYAADMRRRHRWIRGDWQIASWLSSRVPGPQNENVNNPISALSRWKIFDNLRRSLVPMSLVALLLFGWMLAPAASAWCAWLVITVLFGPGTLALLSDAMVKPQGLPIRIHLRNVRHAAVRHFGQAVLTLTAVNADAVLRTWFRLLVTQRNLLEWQTASEIESRVRTDLVGHARTMWWSPAVAAGIGVLVLASPAGIAALPFLALWGVAPIIAWWISRPLHHGKFQITAEQRRSLRITARKTWRYFEVFVSKTENWLPPDNFQEYPRPTIATRTSPTNIGMALTSTMVAWDFGYLSNRQLAERIGQMLDTLGKLERYQGHFYNWYDTRSLQPLPPLYISTVDNGNLAGLLLTLRQALLEAAVLPLPSRAGIAGLRDTLACWVEAVAEGGGVEATKLLSSLAAIDDELAKPSLTVTRSFPLLGEILHRLETLADPSGTEPEESRWWRQAFKTHCQEFRDGLLASEAHFDLPSPSSASVPSLDGANLARRSSVDEMGWSPTLADLEARLAALGEAPPADGVNSTNEEGGSRELREVLFRAIRRGKEQATQFETLAARCEELARMDFTFLYSASRKLFAIGYNVATRRLDGCYYDLLASEARLTSFVAVALGQVPQEHWFALGRSLTVVEQRGTLLSWSGSMFEYLMPPLVMPSYETTLLDVSCRSAIARQIEYAEKLGVPWGISESGYNLTDAQSNYQYRAFGVPGLGFKRGLADDLVIAPYATLMSLLYMPNEAFSNLERLRAEGADGAYGFYEALDYTPARLPRGRTHSVVRSFMAHHQGMALLALDACLLGRPMQRRFEANPWFRATELLLQERLPKQTTALSPHENEANRERIETASAEETFRVFTNPNAGTPEAHLLSNSRYHVMITSAGGGYSLCHDTMLTRWREDPTRDCWGAFVYLRDLSNGTVWSAAYQPTLIAASKYEAIFTQGRAEFRTRAHAIDSHLEIAVSPEDDIEVRRVTLINHSSEPRTIELTSYAEVALNSAAADQSHPAFSKLFVQTELLRPLNAIVCSRRPRARGERPPWLFHLMHLAGQEAGEISFETDRAQFLGRGREAFAPQAMEVGNLSNSEGPVLDPVLAIRRAVRLDPNQSARFVLVTGSAPSRELLLKLVEKYQDTSLADRVFELAWTHGQVMLRHLDATEQHAQLFGRLAGALLYSNPYRRASTAILTQNRRGQRSLWSFGISGDLPILLLRASNPDNMELVRELLKAHAYWRLKGLPVDLVILNEDNSVYRQSVHDQIMALIASGTEAHLLDKSGGIFVRRTDQLSHEDGILLQSVARIVLSDELGSVTEQWQQSRRGEQLPPPFRPVRRRPAAPPSSEVEPRDLLFFNGLGGFTPDGREYVILLPRRTPTPAPWVNVLGNPGFGTLISEAGSAYTWAENCHEFRLTPWHNDPISDLTGEAFFIRDDQTGQVWSPTPAPVSGDSPCVIRHGFGYTVFEMTVDGIASELWVYVATDAPMKFARLLLRNLSARERSLSVYSYWEWVLGESRARNQLSIATELDLNSGALLARNPYNTDFAERVAFATATGNMESFTCDRTEFIGRNRRLADPAALGRQRLSGRTGIGLDACAALKVRTVFAPGEQREIIFKMGAANNRNEALSLLQRFKRMDDCRDAIYMVRAQWNAALGAVQVETPDPALNVLANGWLLYQTMSARLWARSGFYQSGGAFGFRDQLQDAMALIHARPELLREQLLRAAARQFREGDVQHWWHPPAGRGVRTHFSDDYLWLPYATCRYVESVGDTGVLDEKTPFLEGRPVRPNEEAYYDIPIPSAETGSLYEHCVRAIHYGCRFGEHGLPLIGCGDWNDGMNLVGEHGKGESVWLAFFLHDVLTRFGGIARQRGDHDLAERWVEQAEQLRANIEKHGWDERWYRRAYFDNGEPLGSASNPECQIDSLPQSWAALTGVGDIARTRLGMEAVNQRLVKRDARLIQLFDPPFDTSHLDPGYIKGYPPGVRENGGQYTHGAIWTIMAYAALGDAQRAWELFDLINPVRHGDTAAGIARYKVEPYVVAADVYSVPPHTSRGGWTWYTGSAGWLYRLITESLLGIRLQVDALRFAPCLPPHWQAFKMVYHYRETPYRIHLARIGPNWQGNQIVRLDGIQQPQAVVHLQGDRQEHVVEVQFL